MAEANVEAGASHARLGATVTGDAATDAAVQEFVAQVSECPFVQEIALTELWGQRTVWVVVAASTPERTKAILSRAVPLLIKFPTVRLDFRVMNAAQRGEAEVRQLLTTAGTVHLWSRSASLVS